VLALQDPGAAGEPGTPLQRVQIVKGWVDGAGQAQEQVFEVAGDPDNGASVDTDSCQPQGSGFDTLCAVWEDPDFAADQRAFYYARVLENPTCRWSKMLCNDVAVDCSDPGSVSPGLEACCDGSLPDTVQERAWSSPVFYRPESLGRLSGALSFAGAGGDSLRLSAKIQRFPSAVDLAQDDLAIELRDDDVIWAVTIPAGTLDASRPGLFKFRDATGSQLNGLRNLTLRIRSNGEGILSLSTVPMDLSNAEAADHELTVRLSAGAWSAEHRRRWQLLGGRLRPRP
jgi:hypothetical protein